MTLNETLDYFEDWIKQYNLKRQTRERYMYAAKHILMGVPELGNRSLRKSVRQHMEEAGISLNTIAIDPDIKKDFEFFCQWLRQNAPAKYTAQNQTIACRLLSGDTVYHNSGALVESLLNKSGLKYTGKSAPHRRRSKSSLKKITIVNNAPEPTPVREEALKTIARKKLVDRMDSMSIEELSKLAGLE